MSTDRMRRVSFGIAVFMSAILAIATAGLYAEGARLLPVLASGAFGFGVGLLFGHLARLRQRRPSALALPSGLVVAGGIVAVLAIRGVRLLPPAAQTPIVFCLGFFMVGTAMYVAVFGLDDGWAGRGEAPSPLRASTPEPASRLFVVVATSGMGLIALLLLYAAFNAYVR